MHHAFVAAAVAGLINVMNQHIVCTVQSLAEPMCILADTLN